VDRASLISALRSRIVAQEGWQSAAKVDAISDKRLLAAYMECHVCKRSVFADQGAAVRNSSSVAEFIDLVNMALAAHRC
jgi:hypothetical protein